jgi:hypothetical protein
MNDAKYIGMDVHQATICAAVRDSSGNLVMERTIVKMHASWPNCCFSTSSMRSITAKQESVR